MGGSLGAQAGSTFKAFTLAAAFEKGIDPFEKVVSPPRKTFDGFTNCKTGAPFDPYSVGNSTGSGTFDMFQGTAYSVNTYFMALQQKTGQCRPAEIAEELGATRGDGKKLLRVPSFTLGTNEVTPLGMAASYGVFAANGVKCQPVAIARVTDRDGKDLTVPRANCEQVMRPRVAASVTVMLKGVIDGPLPGRTGQAMSLGRDAAGKTGTNNDSSAVWFVGYTPDVSAAVVTYDPRGGYKFPMKNIVIGGRYFDQVFGSTLPGPIWKMAMLSALEGVPPTKFNLTSAGDLAVRATAKPTPTASPSPTVSASPSATGGPAPSPSPTSTPKPTPTPTPSPSSTKPGNGNGNG